MLRPYFLSSLHRCRRVVDLEFKRMLRTILILAAASLLCSVAYAQTKIGDNVLDIDSASILELESSSRGFLPSRMTSAQRDAQTQWDQAHIIYNTTENCLQIYTGSLWLCLQQGTPIDSSIYKQNGTLQSDRNVMMDGNDLTFDGSKDITITSDGRLGIGDSTPEAQLDVEGGTVRLSDYGNGAISGQRTFLLGVDSSGDVIEVDTASVGTDDQTIDALFISNDTLFISLEDDGVSDLFVNLAPYLDDINIYQANDTLSSNRTVNMDGKYIQFSNSDGRTRTRIENDGDLSQTGRNISHTLTDTSQDVQLELSAQGSFSTIGNTSDHSLNIIQNGTTAISVRNNDYIRMNNYGDGNRTGTPSYIIGVDTDGDLLDVDLSTIGSDEQMIDTFSINGSNQLQLSLENDGEAAQTVDLSPYLDDQTVSITGAGINAVTGTYPNFTITGTEVDGSITNEAITNFTYTASSGQLRITENATDYNATVSVMSGASGGSAGVRGLVPDALAGEQTYLLTGAGTWVDPTSLSGANIYTANGTLDADRTVGLSTFDLVFDGTSDIVFETDGDVGIGTVPTSRLDVESQDNEDAFRFVQTDALTGEKDVFTIEDQDEGGGGQDESSVLKVVKSGTIDASDLGFSLIELANTNTDPGDSKYWISGRKVDEGAPLWGVDITDNDYWSEGGIVLGVAGADGGTYSGGTFIVEPDGDVGIGTTTPGARLEVTGGSVIFDEYGIGTYNDTLAEYILATNPAGDVVELNTAKNTRWFYPPPIILDASIVVTGDTMDVHAVYVDQFTNGSGATNFVKSSSAGSTLPIYSETELAYWIVYYDDTILDNVLISDSGVLTYDIIAIPDDNYTIITIIFEIL